MRARRTPVAVVVAVMCAAAAAAPRAARADGAELDRFEVSERGSRFFTADSLELERPQPITFAAGTAVSYAHDLRVYGSSPDPTTDLVSDELAIHVGGALFMHPGFRLAVDVPIVLQNGADTNLANGFYGQPASPVPGDTRVSFDFRLFGPPPERDGVTLATGVSVYLPSGSRDDYTSDEYARVAARVAAAAHYGPVLAAARVQAMYRRELEDFGEIRMGDELDATLGLGYRVAAPVFVGPELHAATILRNSPFGRKETPVEGLIGAHASVADFRFGAGAGAGLVSGFGSAAARVLLSIEWSPGGGARPDRDHDGVPDAEDTCPDVPGAAGGASPGCPPPPHDTDRDGILDSEDACPELAGIHTRDAMTNGCPDFDRDGIPDPIDACPRQAGEASRVPRFNGCPADADGDGVPDEDDVCPDVAGVKTDDPRTTGCPPPPPPPSDRDNDGVVDLEDACPDVPGPRTNDPTTRGCPPVTRSGDALVTIKPVTFQPVDPKKPLAAPTITPDGDEALKGLADYLVANPTLRVRVVVTTVAKQRDPGYGKAVVDRLVALGVSRRRLEARVIASASAAGAAFVVVKGSEERRGSRE